MIRKSLIESIFESASIERWNDHIRPSRGFTELDKQSHKMLYAYVLGKLNPSTDWLKLIEGGIFEFLHRLLLTDIKPPIFHKLMEEKGEAINKWAIASLETELSSIPDGFIQRFEQYLLVDDYAKEEKRLLEAAHYLATKWEFDIIYDMCHNYYGIESTKREIDGKLQGFEQLPYFLKYMNDNNLHAFTNLIGELRFQQRWSRSPRIPATSVMGHMLTVAILSYFCSCEIGACPERLVNNFLGGLFHDIPEVMTRDIVSPVKNSVAGLDALIKEIENEQMESRLYPLIDPEWQKQLAYFTDDEFSSKIIINGAIQHTTSVEITRKYNRSEYAPVDGEIIRGCDHLSAYIETYISHTSGVTSHTLTDGNKGLYEKYQNSVIGGMDFGVLFDYFRI